MVFAKYSLDRRRRRVVAPIRAPPARRDDGRDAIAFFAAVGRHPCRRRSACGGGRGYIYILPRGGHPPPHKC
jgi:hypothetical protein